MPVDTVYHTVLLSELSTFSFSPNALKWIDSYLSDRSQIVWVDNHQSTALSSSTGVSQGSTLGPLLFSLYANDIPSLCPKIDSNVRQWHNNKCNTKSQVAFILTKAMAHVTHWLNHCYLQLNVPKTTGISQRNLAVIVSHKYLYLDKNDKLSKNWNMLGLSSTQTSYSGLRLGWSTTGSNTTY